MKKGVYTISRYIFDRLKEIGIGHIFGVPGDFNLTPVWDQQQPLPAKN